jgi:hypothetical protein
MLHYFENLDCTYKFLLSIKIKMQMKQIMRYFNVWGTRLGDAAGERCPPNGSRRKNVPPMLDPASFEGVDPASFDDVLGDVAGDALSPLLSLPCF